MINNKKTQDGKISFINTKKEKSPYGQDSSDFFWDSDNNRLKLIPSSDMNDITLARKA